LYLHWIIENHHHAVASVAFERAVVFDDDFADGRVVVAQQGHYVFSVSAFSEACETAQITEKRSYLATVAFELLLRTRGNNQISHLWRQKTPQPAHALDFVHLVGDALFELLVEFHQLLGLRFYLLCSLAQFVEQPRILDCDDGLSGEVRQQLDLFIRERTNLLTVDA